MADVRNLQHVTVYRDPEGKWNGAFPEIGCMSNGDLVAAFRQAPYPATPIEGSPARVHAHGDVRARGAIIRSTDGGMTWDHKTFRILAEPPNGVEQMAVSVLSGDFLLSRHARCRSDRTGNDLWVRRSSDRGDTWDEAMPIDMYPLTSTAVHAPVLELPDGTILAPHCGPIGTSGPGQHAQIVIRSTDQGRTWGDPSVIAYDTRGFHFYHQCSLVRMADGEIIALFWCWNMRQGLDGEAVNTPHIWLSRSWDDGRTWIPVEEIPFRTTGATPSLIGLHDGRLLCVWSHRGDPSIRAAVSEDRGRSWSTYYGTALREKPGLGFRDIGEPCSRQLPDGRIVSVYYWFNSDEDPILYIEAAFYTV